MIDSVTAQPMVNSLARLELEQVAPAQPLAANPADQARFQQILHLPPETPVTLPVTVVTELRVERPLTPGDAILQSLDKMRAGFQDLNGQIATIAQQPELSPLDLLMLQMQVSQVTLNAQLVNQVASKIEQDMNALLKSS